MIEEWSRHVKLFQHLIAAIRRFHLHFIQILKEASFSSSSSSAAVARDKSPAAHHNGLSSGSMRLAVRSRSWLSSLIIVTMLLNISSASYLLPRISSSSDNVVAIPLLGSPNTGYCAYITIGTPAVQEVCCTAAVKTCAIMLNSIVLCASGHWKCQSSCCWSSRQLHQHPLLS